MDRLFVDTSAWYAFFNRKDPAHQNVGKALEAWAGRLLFTDYVFDEIVTLIRSRLGSAKSVEIGRPLRSGGVAVLVRVELADFQAAWNQFSREVDKGYSFTDCTSFAVMRRLGVQRAAATDEHFRQAGFEVLGGGEAVTP